MMKFTVEQYGEAKEAAKEFGINPVGKKKEVLVDLVNEAIAQKAADEVENTIEVENTEEVESTNEVEETTTGEEAAPKETVAKSKWYDENKLDVAAGDTIQIITKSVVKDGVAKEILKDRYATVIGPSPKKNMVRVILLNEKTGELQNCPITVEVGKYNKMPEDWKFTQTSVDAVEEDVKSPEDAQQSA